MFPADPAVVPKEPVPGFRVCEGPADAVLAADLAEPFDLRTGPLVRLTVIRHRAERLDLVLTSHHVLSGGWSAPRILTELFALYTARARGEAPFLPVPVPFGRYLDWRAAHEPDLGAWADELEGLPEGDYLGAGPDGPGPAWQEPEVVTFDAPLVAGLTRLAARRGLTPSILVRGAWAALLARRHVAVVPPLPRRAAFDVRGAALLSPGLAVLVLGLTEAAHGRTVPATLGVTAGLLMLAGLVVHGLRAGDTALVAPGSSPGRLSGPRPWPCPSWARRCSARPFCCRSTCRRGAGCRHGRRACSWSRRGWARPPGPYWSTAPSTRWPGELW